MKSVIFMFPGVGSHHIGMGKNLYSDFQVFRDTFDEASDVLKMDISKICFSSSEKSKLEELEYSQTTLVAVSVATYRVYMQEIGWYPQFSMGHSLGEYSALCCAGVISFADTLIIVKQRGIILNKIASLIDGMMAWVINIDNKVVEDICRDYSSLEKKAVFVSAYDTPTQASISGLKDDVIKIGRILENKGAIVYPLKLSGPFHSPYMEEASQQIKLLLSKYEYGTFLFPVVANFNAEIYPTDKQSIINILSLQLTSPIRWQTTISNIQWQEIDAAIEMGPDKVLSHIMKNNTPMIKNYSLHNKKDLQLISKEILMNRN